MTVKDQPAPVPVCTTDADCEGGTCVDGICQTSEPPSGCTTDADCSELGPGAICLEGRCAVPAAGCTTDAECPEGMFCALPSEGSGKCAPVPCEDCVCGDCVLQVGEVCEPGAVPGGPGACGADFVCDDVSCECVPEEPVDAGQLCLMIASVACDPVHETLDLTALPPDLAAGLDADATCGDIFFGGCAETTVEGQTVGCCTPGVCGDLSALETGEQACGLYELLANIGNEGPPVSGDDVCAEAFGGECNGLGCCEPEEVLDFCDETCTSTPGCTMFSFEFCADELCPNLGPGFGVTCTVGVDGDPAPVCQALQGDGAPVTGNCVEGCCEPDPCGGAPSCSSDLECGPGGVCLGGCCAPSGS